MLKYSKVTVIIGSSDSFTNLVFTIPLFFLSMSLILFYCLTLLALLHRKRHFATLLSFISRAFPSYKLIVQLCPLPWLDNKYLSGIISLQIKVSAFCTAMTIEVITARIPCYYPWLDSYFCQIPVFSPELLKSIF